MSNTPMFNDPALQVATVNDFTPGIITAQRSTQYPLAYGAQPGSASMAWRCYGVPGVGLCPFPQYTQVASYGLPGSTTASSFLTAASMQTLGPNALAATPGSINSYDNIAVLFAGCIGPALTAAYEGVIFSLPPANIEQGVSWGGSTVTLGQNMPLWNNMIVGAFQGTNTDIGIAKSVVFADSLHPGGTVNLVFIYNYNSNAEAATHPIGTAPAFNGTSQHGYPLAFTSERIVLLESHISNLTTPHGFQSFNVATYSCSDIQLPTVTQGQQNPNFVFPEMGPTYGSWGSISTGEFIVIYCQQGAVIIQGDIAFPASATKLPGVTGTGTGALGPGIESPMGLLYPTDYDGVYAWNGGNTSTKVSMQVPDAQFIRNTTTIWNGPNIPSPFGMPGPCTHHSDMFGQWAMFANNWVLDTITQSWWRSENPAITSMEVFCQQSTPRYFLAIPTSVVNLSAGATLRLPIFQFDRSQPAFSYVWQSNPLLPNMAGALVDLEEVEIVVTDFGLGSTIVVSPVPSGDPSATAVGFPNVPGSNTLPGGTFDSVTHDTYITPPQYGVLFNIPAGVHNYRVGARMGWSDSQLSIRVDVVGNGVFGPPGEGPAPVIHEINIGYNYSRTSNAP